MRFEPWRAYLLRMIFFELSPAARKWWRLRPPRRCSPFGIDRRVATGVVIEAGAAAHRPAKMLRKSTSRKNRSRLQPRARLAAMTTGLQARKAGVAIDLAVVAGADVIEVVRGRINRLPGRAKAPWLMTTRLKQKVDLKNSRCSIWTRALKRSATDRIQGTAAGEGVGIGVGADVGVGRMMLTEKISLPGRSRPLRGG